MHTDRKGAVGEWTGNWAVAVQAAGLQRCDGHTEPSWLSAVPGAGSGAGAVEHLCKWLG